MSYSRSDPAPPLFVSLALLVASVALIAWTHSCHVESCQTACEGQYGHEWKARVTETEYSHLCDCIGPDGEIKAPR